MRRAFDALRRRHEDQQRQVDCLLTREPHKDLELRAKEVRSATVCNSPERAALF